MVCLPKFFDAGQGSAISLRPYGEQVRFHTRTKGENSRQNQDNSDAGSCAALLSCVWTLELGIGRRFYERPCTHERLDSRPEVWFPLRRVRLLDLWQHSVFQPSSIRVCAGDRARYGRDAQTVGSQVKAWQTKPQNTAALMFQMLTSLCLGGLRITS